jgi:hypothetical protein
MALNYSTPTSNSDLIPNGTLARVRMQIRPGGYDESPDWTGGWATQGQTGTIYLNAEVVITTGPFTGRKIQHRIGLRSTNPRYAQMGFNAIRGILHSARGISFKDHSPASRAKLTIDGLGDLDGIEFAAVLGVEIDSMSGIERNIIKHAITIDHLKYHEAMGGASGSSAEPAVPPTPAPNSGPISGNLLPPWAR